MFGLSSRLFAGGRKPDRQPTFKPRCEALERRDLMATWTGIPVGGITVVNGGSLPPMPTAAGLALINGLPATAVRTAALADYQRDGYLSRSDMMDIMSKGTVGYTWAAPGAFASLKTLVNNGATVGMPGYVQDLASKTLLDANAELQAEIKAMQADGVPNAVLQRFLAQAPATLAQDIHGEVNNWFFGQVHPDARYVDHGQTVTPTYQLVNLPLFNGTPRYQDVAQGALGDCWLMASFAEVADRNPGAIRGMFIDNGDGTYTVRFYNGSTSDYVTVDKYLPNGGRLYDHPQGDLWVALAEKAYAQENGAGWIGSGHRGVDSYQALSGGWPHWALPAITGHAAVAFDSVNADSVMKAWWQGSYVVLCTGDSPASSQVVHNHCYALVNYASAQFALFNPWGINAVSYPGLINVSCAELPHNFTDWAKAGAAAGPAGPQAVATDAFAQADMRPAAAVVPDQTQRHLRQDTQGVLAARAGLPADSALLASLLSVKDRDGASRPASSDAAGTDPFGEPGAL